MSPPLRSAAAGMLDPRPASPLHAAPVCRPRPQVRDMAGDGQVMKRIVRKGEGEFPVDCPLEDSRVRMHCR